MVTYKKYQINLRRQWDALKQKYNYSVQILKEGRFITGFYSNTKTKGLLEAKKNINKIIKR